MDLGRDEDISLFDIWRVISRRKGLILLALLASILLGASYLFFANPVYKATAHLLPPQNQNIQGLLLLMDYGAQESADAERYTPESVYSAFLENLKSQGLRREFFEANNLASHYVSGSSNNNVDVDLIFDAEFSGNLQVQVDKEDPAVVTVSFNDTSPELAAQWLNQIIDFANQRTIDQLLGDVNARIQAEINQLASQLASKLKVAEQRRHDAIVNLKEALRVARALGIKDPNTLPKVEDKVQARLSINTAEVPLYMRGTDALETEIAVLESRKSDEPFINGFRDLQERRVFLQGVSVDPDTLSAVTINAAARVPYRAEQPRKSRVLAMAIVLGFVFAGAGVVIAEFVSKVPRKPRSTLD